VQVPTLPGRSVLAAVAGASAAATGHALDVAGLLPFVHETAAVRAAMTPAQVVAWLLTAGVLSAIAAATRPVLVGAPAALLVSAVPELVGRHDVGAVAEPSAICGALLQLLLVVAVVALAVALQRHVVQFPAPPTHPVPRGPLHLLLSSFAAAPVDRTSAPRAPPGHVVVMT
jgi:hypothetical protein